MSLGLLLAEDLIFISRIVGTARAANLQVRSCRTPDALCAAAAAELPGGVLVDLHHPGLDIADLVRRLKALGNIRIIGYGSHVDTATLKQARTAGCDLVLPRSKFVENLPNELPKWLE